MVMMQTGTTFSSIARRRLIACRSRAYLLATTLLYEGRILPIQLHPRCQCSISEQVIHELEIDPRSTAGRKKRLEPTQSIQAESSMHLHPKVPGSDGDDHQVQP